jgi:hypothetical protein
MNTTITRLFDNYSDAAAAVADLKTLGIPDSNISLVASNADKQHGDHSETAEDAGKGALGGAVVGGAGGLLAGLGMLAIPGLGPVVAAGWLAATAVGAGVGAAAGGAGGGLVGALQESGETPEDARIYSEGVRRGGTLVSANVPEGMIVQAQRVLDAHKSVAATVRGEEYRAAGWSSDSYANDVDPIDVRRDSSRI